MIEEEAEVTQPSIVVEDRNLPIVTQSSVMDEVVNERKIEADIKDDDEEDIVI